MTAPDTPRPSAEEIRALVERVREDWPFRATRIIDEMEPLLAAVESLLEDRELLDFLDPARCRMTTVRKWGVEFDAPASNATRAAMLPEDVALALVGVCRNERDDDFAAAKIAAALEKERRAGFSDAHDICDQRWSDARDRERDRAKAAEARVRELEAEVRQIGAALCIPVGRDVLQEARKWVQRFVAAERDRDEWKAACQKRTLERDGAYASREEVFRVLRGALTDEELQGGGVLHAARLVVGKLAARQAGEVEGE